jgi:hypothetical protein
MTLFINYFSLSYCVVPSLKSTYSPQLVLSDMFHQLTRKNQALLPHKTTGECLQFPCRSNQALIPHKTTGQRFQFPCRSNQLIPHKTTGQRLQFPCRSIRYTGLLLCVLLVWITRVHVRRPIYRRGHSANGATLTIQPINTHNTEMGVQVSRVRPPLQTVLPRSVAPPESARPQCKHLFRQKIHCNNNNNANCNSFTCKLNG